MGNLEIFCRLVRERSKENSQALHLLYRARLISPLISTLRQELDSLIKVLYLLSISNLEYRDRLIQASVEGRKWRDEEGHYITDRKMVDKANELYGWTNSVYRFGCAFVHLSNFHDYQARDPMNMISYEEKNDILRHMRYYHGGPSQDNPTLEDLVEYLPRVGEKISSNLQTYLEHLEARGSLELPSQKLTTGA